MRIERPARGKFARLAWFVGLWAASVGVVVVLAWTIRAALKM